MNRFTLPTSNLCRIHAQLNLTGTFNHTCKSAFSDDCIAFKLHLERGAATTAATVEMGSERHSVTLLNSNPRAHLELADFIDAIANGRVDSAEPAPPRITAIALVPEPEPLLDTDQQEQLRHLVKVGGALLLDVGLTCPVAVTGHRTYTRPGLTAIACIGNARPRTICFTTTGKSDEVIYCRLLTSIENLAAAGTPAAAAA